MWPCLVVCRVLLAVDLLHLVLEVRGLCVLSLQDTLT